MNAAPISQPSPHAAWMSRLPIRLLLILGVPSLIFLQLVPFPFKVPLVGLLGLGIVWWETRSASACGLQRRSLGRTLAWAVSLLVALLVLGVIVAPLVEQLMQTKTDFSSYGDLAGNLPATAALLGGVWLSAAIGEELLFRVFLLHQLDALLARIRGRALLVPLIVGVIFGLVHAPQGPAGIVTTGIAGVLLTWTYQRSGRNLWALVLAHGLIDTLAVLSAYFA